MNGVGWCTFYQRDGSFSHDFSCVDEDVGCGCATEYDAPWKGVGTFVKVTGSNDMKININLVEMATSILVPYQHAPLFSLYGM